MYYAAQREMLTRKMSNNSIGLSSTESDDSSVIADCSKINVHLIADGGCGRKLHHAYQSLLTLLDKELNIVFASERNINIGEAALNSTSNGKLVPSLAVVLFFNHVTDETNNNGPNFLKPQISKTNPQSGVKELKGIEKHDALEKMGIFIDDDDLSDREFEKIKMPEPLDRAREQLRIKPWKLHHEETPKDRITLCSENKQDFYMHTTDNANGQGANEFDYPLVGVRQMHYGRQILRFTLFVDEENWEEQLDFYKLILGKQIIAPKADFHYFIIWSTDSTDVEFALKKISFKETRVCLRRTVLEFNVQNLPLFVPLLPHECNPISNLRWQTKDYEGNLILFHVQHTNNSPMSNVIEMFNKVNLQIQEKRRNSVDIKTETKQQTYTNNSYDSKTLPTPKKKRKCRVYYSDTENIMRHKCLDRSDSFEEITLPQSMPLLKPSLYSDLAQKFPLKWGQTNSLSGETKASPRVCKDSSKYDKKCREKTPKNKHVPKPNFKTFRSPSFANRPPPDKCCAHAPKISPTREINENKQLKMSVPQNSETSNFQRYFRKKPTKSSPIEKVQQETSINNTDEPEAANKIDERVAKLILTNTVEVDDVEIYV